MQIHVSQRHAGPTALVNALLDDTFTERDFARLLPCVGRTKVESMEDLLSMLNMLLLANAVKDEGSDALHACLDFLEPIVERRKR